ncbi:hypothetical protein ACRAKI_21725 [Saccharothrix isguenensis]
MLTMDGEMMPAEFSGEMTFQVVDNESRRFEYVNLKIMELRWEVRLPDTHAGKSVSIVIEQHEADDDTPSWLRINDRFASKYENGLVFFPP